MDFNILFFPRNDELLGDESWSFGSLLFELDEQFTFSGAFYLIFQNVAFQVLPIIRFRFTRRESDLHPIIVFGGKNVRVLMALLLIII